MKSSVRGERSSFDILVPDNFENLPGCFRMLLGLDGTLTRSLTFLSGSPVTVEPVSLPVSPRGVRKVFLSVRERGRLVFARTQLLPSSESHKDPRIGEIMKGESAIGQSMEAHYGPLLKDEFAIFSLSGKIDPDCPVEFGVTWARSYRMSTSGGIRLRIEEFFLPALLRLAGGE